MKLKVGQRALPFAARDIRGNLIRLEDFAGGYLLLSFLRFAGCPRCGLRIYSLTLRYPALRERGLQVVTFVESSAENILRQSYAREAPFSIIADPDLLYYQRYGVRTSRFGLFWGGLTRKKELAEAYALGFGQGPMDGDDRRMPADFLIGPNLQVLHAHYGRDSGDVLRLEDIERRLPQPAPVLTGQE